MKSHARAAVMCAGVITTATIVTGAEAAEVGQRKFSCEPTAFYEMTPSGLEVITDADFVSASIKFGKFMFDEASAVKREDGKAAQYQILNPENKLQSPVVAKFGKLNPTLLVIQRKPSFPEGEFMFIRFGGAINMSGKCIATD